MHFTLKGHPFGYSARPLLGSVISDKEMGLLINRDVGGGCGFHFQKVLCEYYMPLTMQLLVEPDHCARHCKQRHLEMACKGPKTSKK